MQSSAVHDEIVADRYPSTLVWNKTGDVFK